MSLSDRNLAIDSYRDPPWHSSLAGGRPIPEYHAHLEIVKSWLRLCDEQHGSQCHAKKEDSDIWPLWLIDVVECCIVDGNRATRYLTLSYVWGGVHTLQATTSNIEDLQQPRSLDQFGDTLPKTIRQAMEFTRLIGEQYIWIDQLCILQDDALNKEFQIDHMAELYANSHLTLVAASGESAASGLGRTLGLGPSETRRWKYEQYSKILHHGWPLQESTWGSRGWTFQENIFARRAIFFLKYTVDFREGEGLTWECEHAGWTDLQGPVTLEKSLRLKPHRGRFDGLHHRSWPDLYEYTHLADTYAKRKFTYPSDVIPAFSGFATVVGKSFRGGILYGLPALFFDVALLWQSPRLATRRVVSSHSGIQTQLPSWSWVSWPGQVNLALWTAGCEYLELFSTSLVVNPLVKWHIITSDNIRVAIESDYHKYRHLFDAADGELPSGWSRVVRDAIRSRKRPQSWSSNAESYAYKHSTDARTIFNYPIPLVEPFHIDAITPKSNLITCRANRAWFSMVVERSLHPSLYTSIFDSNKVWSGMLDIVYNGLVNKGSTSATVNNPRCELIAISTGSVLQDPRYDIRSWFKEERHPRRPNTGTRYYFYNVLWIEWVEGIAFRKALGRVHKAAWDAAERELIDVILG
ncbi:HET-domain-containing protein [Cucurbitaria berberidis CBS 394.84]|uniref:HET-domain-containing protein n=1 Tax=Cucurbitaria berberidis CBS 394.84 TaxID=1168544 RepID=A0A9P4GVC0_9PLEO|nr:HET-domain-containing protein [Cucurbitaria berberidis CBS 394.84]KAF1851982.1 HET-domain-containing protein [Cucurbitaria berberidis CBS 394.84]